MNKYQKDIDKAKTMKALEKVASHMGVGIGRYKNLSNAKKFLTEELKRQKSSVTQEMKVIRQKLTSSRSKLENRRKQVSADNEVLDTFNKYRHKLGSVHDVNVYLGKTLGEFQTISELNFLMHEFKNIKGKITMNKVKKVAKGLGYTPGELLGVMKEKTDKLDFNTYRGLLEFYGFKSDEIDEMAEIFNNAGYKRQDYMLKVINDFAKGKNRYQDEDIEHDIARGNFRANFDLFIKLGKNWEKEDIDDL